MCMSPNRKILILLMLLTACVNDVDFNQAYDFSAQPTYIASIAHFTFDQHKFLDSLGNELFMITDAAPAQLNTSTLVQNNLMNATVQFKVTNQFNRTIVLVLRFYSAGAQQTFTLNPISIPPNTVNGIYTQTISGADLTNLKNSSITRLDVVLMAGVTPIDPAINKSLNVQVSGIFDFNFNN